MFKEQSYEFSIRWDIGYPLLSINMGDHTSIAQVTSDISEYRIKHAGFDIHATVRETHIYQLSKLIPKKSKNNLSKLLLSPMPGQVVKVCVQENQKVNSGDDLIILDAMKMENILKADKDAVVKKINIQEGNTVSVDQELIVFS
jgi:propionyl-CoA carboxylase alpha chain